jgi:peptidyl-prolyl cis-trans isomerase C
MRKSIFSVAFICLLVSGCAKPTQSSTPAAATDTASPTAVSMTSTPDVPMAALVNSEGIPDSDFQAELNRFKVSHPDMDADAASKTVLDEMVDTVLLAQGAAAEGYVLDDAGLEAKIQALRDQLGGDEALQAWMNTHQYTTDQFRYALRQSSAAAWMRDKITQAVSATGDEVHVRQILFTEEANAQSVLQEVRTGADFATLAEQYDPITRGDIGWFPRGYLTQAKVEEAAFALQPGEVSEVISSDIGFHLIQVIERDANHTLSPDAYLSAQKQAISQWLVKQRESSQIEIRNQ